MQLYNQQSHYFVTSAFLKVDTNSGFFLDISKKTQAKKTQAQIYPKTQGIEVILPKLNVLIASIAVSFCFD